MFALISDPSEKASRERIYRTGGIYSMLRVAHTARCTLFSGHAIVAWFGRRCKVGGYGGVGLSEWALSKVGKRQKGGCMRNLSLKGLAGSGKRNSCQ